MCAASDTFTEELCEIGEAFYDMTNNQIDMNFRAPKVTITSKINGIWGPGFHAGVYDAGFTHLFGGYGLIMRSAGITVEGFSLRQQAGVGTRNLETVGFNSLAQQMFFVGVARTTNSEGMRLGAVGATAKNCVAIGLHRGFSFSPYSAYLTAIGCFATDNTIGFGNQSDLATNSSATAINCLSIGNATDWFVQGPLVSASNNAGLGTSAWMVGTGATRITIGADWNTTAPLFRDYANKGYRPFIPLNANSSLLVGYASGLPVFIPFIDAVVVSGTSIQSANFQYGSGFTCRYRVRKGTTPSIVPFESTLAVTSAGGSGTAVRNADE